MYFNFPIGEQGSATEGSKLLARASLAVMGANANEEQQYHSKVIVEEKQGPDFGMWTARAESKDWCWPSGKRGLWQITFTICSTQLSLYVEGGDSAELIRVFKTVAAELGTRDDMPMALNQAELSQQGYLREPDTCDALIDHLRALGVALNTDDAAELLGEAVRRGLHERVAELLSRGIAPNHVSASNAKPALLVAVACRHTEIVKQLLQAKAQPDQRDSLGRSSLWSLLASETGTFVERAELFRLLTEAGADPNAVDNKGQRLVHQLAYMFHTEGIENLRPALVKAGMDFAKVDADGATVADLARKWNRPAPLVALLDELVAAKSVPPA